jgi:hypothetical protein
MPECYLDAVYPLRLQHFKSAVRGIVDVPFKVFAHSRILAQRATVTMIFKWRKSKMKPDVFSIAELRTELGSLVERGRKAGLRHYILAEILEETAQAIRLRHETTRPPDYVGLDVSDVRRFLDRNSR